MGILLEQHKAGMVELEQRLLLERQRKAEYMQDRIDKRRKNKAHKNPQSQGRDVNGQKGAIV